MSDWAVFDRNDELGRVVLFRKVEGGTEFATVYLVDGILDANTEARNSAPSGWKGDYHRIASLSPAVAYGDGYVAQAIKEGDDKVLTKWLNDSDNSRWRTKDGTV